MRGLQIRHRFAPLVGGVGAVLAVATGAPAQAPPSLTDSAFAALIVQISEPGGYFDTDNLISNEDAYLHAVSSLRKLGVTGGVYIGVGPDQNFSYIAAIRPRAAFIVDIRRDNLLEHLLFKAIFAVARNRLDYLALLFGRAMATDTTGWGAMPVDSLLAYVERQPRPPVRRVGAPAADSPAAQRSASAAASVAERARTRVMAVVRRSRVPLSADDLATIARFHDAFIAAGPALRFNTFGRAPQPYYPDFRRLASERDRSGRQASFLASEEAFQFVKDLERRNLVIPVVGNFAGPRALAAVADWVRAHDERLSAFYTSNVEQYLFRDGGFGAFAASVARFPRNRNSVLIRSCFTCGGAHPRRLAGYHAVQLVQMVDDFVSLWSGGQLTDYASLTSVGLVNP